MADPPSPTPTAASPERAQVILMDDLDLMRSSATQTDTGAASGVGSEAVSGLVFESSSVVQSPLRPERGTGLAVSEADLTAYTNPESSADTTSTPKKEDKTTQTRIVLHGTLDCARRQHRPCGPEPEVHLFRLSLYRRSIHPIKMRLLMDGPNGQTIRYIEIDSSLCPDGFNGQTIRYIEYDRSLTPPSPYIYGPRDFVLRNPLPTQDWSHASLRPAADGHTVELYNVRTEPAAGLDPDKVWGARPKVEYTELRKVPLNVGRHAMYDDRLCVVRHPLFGRQNLVMKLAVAPEQVAALETEAQVYRDCVGHNLTPNFMGYVADRGSVVGILTEYIWPARTARADDFLICTQVLSDFHLSTDWVHGNPKDEHFIISDGGDRISLVGFRKAFSTADMEDAPDERIHDKERMWWSSPR